MFFSHFASFFFSYFLLLIVSNPPHRPSRIKFSKLRKMKKLRAKQGAPVGKKAKNKDKEEEKNQCEYLDIPHTCSLRFGSEHSFSFSGKTPPISLIALFYLLGLSFLHAC